MDKISSLSRKFRIILAQHAIDIGEGMGESSIFPTFSESISETNILDHFKELADFELSKALEEFDKFKTLSLKVNFLREISYGLRKDPLKALELIEKYNKILSRDGEESSFESAELKNLKEELFQLKEEFDKNKQL